MTKKNYYTYHVNTDYQGTIMAITNQSSSLVAEMSYDAWGRRRTPANWSYTGFASSLFVRGYTGHEHLDQFGLINMNGRCYDPVLGRFLSPDLFVQYPEHTQSYNRYGYVLNNPTIYIDPDGQSLIGFLIIVAVGYIGYSEIKGIAKAIKTGDPSYADPTCPGSPANNSIKITLGLFKTDCSKDFDDQVIQVIKRFTWQLPTTLGGYLMAQNWNLFKDVEKVNYFYGSTVLYDKCYRESMGSLGHSFGGFIVEDIFDYERFGTSARDNTLTHEYGHYLQEQAWGPLTLISGIESSFTELLWPRVKDPRNVWVEEDASQRGLNYFYGKGNFISNEYTGANPSKYGGNYYEERFKNLLLISLLLLW